MFHFGVGLWQSSLGGRVQTGLASSRRSIGCSGLNECKKGGALHRGLAKRCSVQGVLAEAQDDQEVGVGGRHCRLAIELSERFSPHGPAVQPERGGITVGTVDVAQGLSQAGEHKAINSN